MDTTHIIQSGGLLTIAAIIFAESGMMLGFFLPGDTLLLSAGVLASQGKLPLALTIAVVALAAILGDNTGYTIGRTMGPRLFRKKDGIIFRQEYVGRAEKFYEKHGSKTMLLAHFIPIIRSFAPLVAGVGKMPRGQFFVFDAIGDIAWAAITTLVGYWFGSRIKNLDHYILPTFIGVVLLSFGPTLWHLFGNRETRTRILAAILRRNRRTRAANDDSDADR
ncbi:MAG TPA: VTT domain-containing protein [Candidatus Saccharimonadales bacterium]|nr:VTT domain-containing protein [Candidatus Saccharimonadales bacterium]